MTHAIDVVIYPGFKSMEAVGPVNVFTYANRHLERRGDPRRYDIRITAPDPGMIPSDTLLSLEATAKLAADDVADTVMITGAPDIERALDETPMIVDWCRANSGKIPRLAALCSGSFFLAASGALDGRRATTHWSVATLLQQRFPRVQVAADAIFIQDGNLWTSAGVSAAIDLALAFVEHDFGRDLALEVARDLVIFLKRPGGQSQFSTTLTSQMTTSPSVRELQSWVLANLGNPIKVDDLARRAGMSVRNFARLFQKETHTTPAEFIEIARCERAMGLLLDTNLPMKTIAFRCGFPSDEQMRKVFQRRFSLTPREYRERFKTTDSEMHALTFAR
ncbi:GlxA family transcriptional regulator [Sinorhizobium garamanticum]|uniref:GlxA family transcriptional regulator n=1 Tax=Sinorhizobium garamanticum TaxID=680247 RepID=A0ABY8D5Y1_9HYPH|nr:GlxA family transcriptional regulator [Sinorhizobium garamanticum]WEX85732.1 GlxA family transcriptional regulator [Sinorhizobium garamanticum]